MKQYFLTFIFLTVSIVFSSASAVRVGETYPSTSAYVFGTGEQLSGQQFQTDGILTYKNYQYTVYYNSARNVCIARRKMPVGAWEEVTLPYKNSEDDAHNVIVMGICPNDGSIHLAYDHHNHDLHYCYSVKGSANDPTNMPWETASFSETTNIMDKAVPNVTYPRFIAKPDGNLLFECRFRWSGYGDSYLREYNAYTKTWSLIGRYVQGEDVTPDACAYINGMTYDHLGRLHITWCWRDDFGGGTNHDFFYAYSEDNGRTWKDNTGTQVAVTEAMDPVMSKTTGTCLGQTIASLEIEEIAYNRGYINQETQAVDSKGRIFAVNSHIPDGEGTDSNWSSSRTKARLHLRFRKEDGNWVKQLIKCNGNSINSTRRVHLAFDSFDNAYVVANGAGVFRASPVDSYAAWSKLSDIGTSGYYSEPLIDRPLLKNEGVLSFVYLSSDNKIAVFDFLTDNPRTPDGTGLKADYFSDNNFKTLISSEIAHPNGAPIPGATQSIRWSGTLETLKGEQYTLYINTSAETRVFVNDELVKTISETDTAHEYSFTYNPIASHRNNIVIESKAGTPIEFSWSSINTAKESVPSTSLYSAKANDKPSEVTPPVLPKKYALDENLSGEKTINTSDKSTFLLTPFDPVSDYSLEVKAKINTAKGRGMDIEARAKSGKGFRFSLDELSLSSTIDTQNPLWIADADNTAAQTYRFAVQGEKVYAFRDTIYLGSTDIDYVNEIQTDDTEIGIVKNIASSWAGVSGAGTGKPTDYGWEVSGGSPVWTDANLNTSGSIRYLDVTSSSNPQHTLNGNIYKGRLLTLRWDVGLSSAVFYYPVTLKANTEYKFTMLYEHWNNGSIGAPITVGISQSNTSEGIYDSKSFTTITKNHLQEANFKFTSKEAGVYYLCFTGAAETMFAIGELTLIGSDCEPRLLLGKNYNTGSLDAEIVYVSYEEGAFAPGKGGAVTTPELDKKAELPLNLQTAINITTASETKEVYELDFNPTGDYSVEVSVAVISAEGRGLDVEVRDETGQGFRTSLGSSSFRWIAPFSTNSQIVKTDTDNQIIRYAVQNDKVHIFRNGTFVNTYNLAEVGSMDATGTAELPAIKTIDVNSVENKIVNGDFAANAHGDAPTGWVSEKTMGGGTQARVQEKSSTTELKNYPDGTKAFVFRFDNDDSYGTWYSYPVMLKPNTWYTCAFDIIAWGTNTGKSFNVIVSTSQNAASGIVYQESITTPSTGKEALRKTLRFKTANGSTETQYYLTFAKSAAVGSIGSTNFTLVENKLNNILFGKNYTEGSVDMRIDYIAVDYSGAFAPNDVQTNSVANAGLPMDDVLIYSNNKRVTVKTKSELSQVILFDVLGRCRLVQNCSGNEYSTEIQRGVYVVKVRFADGNEYAAKLVAF